MSTNIRKYSYFVKRFFEKISERGEAAGGGTTTNVILSVSEGSHIVEDDSGEGAGGSRERNFFAIPSAAEGFWTYK